MTGVDAVTGRREWRRRLDGTGVCSSLALGRGTLYAATFDGDLFAPPAVAGEYLFVASRKGVYCLGPTDD